MLLVEGVLSMLTSAWDSAEPSEAIVDVEDVIEPSSLLLCDVKARWEAMVRCSASLLCLLGVSTGSVLIKGAVLRARLGVRLSLSRRGRRDRGGDGILARDRTCGLKVVLDGGFVEYMAASEYVVSV